MAELLVDRHPIVGEPQRMSCGAAWRPVEAPLVESADLAMAPRLASKCPFQVACQAALKPPPALPCQDDAADRPRLPEGFAAGFEAGFEAGVGAVAGAEDGA